MQQSIFLEKNPCFFIIAYMFEIGLNLINYTLDSPGNAALSQNIFLGNN